MTARLHVLLGQGGVGKTTLAAGCALALARRGRRVGLLGVDPAGRLRDALGMADIAELPVDVPGCAGVRAALLRPGASLRRWASEELGAGDASAPLLRNPFFLALADRLAAATDAFAAVRVAEWKERDPDLDDLVVDTAPGLHGLEFLGKPEKLLSVLHGRVLRWLSAAATSGTTEREARRILRGLSRIAGGGVLLDLAEFSLLIERVGAAMIGRLERARAWLRDPATELLLVCVARPGAAAAARLLADELRTLKLPEPTVVLNRALPPALRAIRADGEDGESLAFRRFVRASAQLQAGTVGELGASFRVFAAPIAPGLDGEGAAHLAALEALGEGLLRALSAPPAAG